MSKTAAAIRDRMPGLGKENIGPCAQFTVRPASCQVWTVCPTSLRRMLSCAAVNSDDVL
jgi:hypothetical protein